MKRRWVRRVAVKESSFFLLLQFEGWRLLQHRIRVLWIVSRPGSASTAPICLLMQVPLRAGMCMCGSWKAGGSHWCVCHLYCLVMSVFNPAYGFFMCMFVNRSFHACYKPAVRSQCFACGLIIVIPGCRVDELWFNKEKIERRWMKAWWTVTLSIYVSAESTTYRPRLFA